MPTLKIAFATNGKKGLDDTISKVFGRAESFTILDVEDQKIVDVQILENSAKSYHHGAGPITVKMLVDNGVDVVFSNELGIGACNLLKQHNVKHIAVQPNLKVGDVFRQEIKKLTTGSFSVEARI